MLQPNTSCLSAGQNHSKWTAVIAASPLRDRLDAVLDAISEKLLINPVETISAGLFNGCAGEILYWHFLSLYKSDHSFEFAKKRELNALSRKLNETTIGYNFSEGLAGILWVINYLRKTSKNSITLELKSEALLNRMLFERAKSEINCGSHDFLNGAIGPLKYFIDNAPSNPVFKEYVHVLIRELIHNAEIQNQGTTWKEKYAVDGEYYNLGLAHGVSAILVLLCKASQLFHGDYNAIIQQTVKWIRAQQLMNNNVSFFPNYGPVSLASKPTRLAWCYGDLGISWALFKSSQHLQDACLMGHSLSVAKHCIERAESNMCVHDACICHGSAGIAQVFSRFFYETGDLDFKNASAHWCMKTLEYFHSPVGLKNVCFNNLSGQVHCKEDRSILNGYAGIGLSLISAVTDIEPTWDSLLLLS